MRASVPPSGLCQHKQWLLPTWGLERSREALDAGRRRWRGRSGARGPRGHASRVGHVCLARQARTSTRARMPPSAVTNGLPSYNAAWPCDAEAYWRVWVLLRLRAAGLERATIIDVSLAVLSNLLTLSGWAAQARGGNACVGASGRAAMCGVGQQPGADFMRKLRVLNKNSSVDIAIGLLCKNRCQK